MTRVITFGTFDLFHVGHLNVLRRAREMGEHLIVGVSSDELNFRKKGFYPTYPLEHRMAIVESIRYVDAVFVEHSLEEKRQYIVDHGANILIMGDDWEGKFDHLSEVCSVVYVPRTEGISSSGVKQHIQASLQSPLVRRAKQPA